MQNSHIIPEFIYKPLYDKNHKFYGLNMTSKHKEDFHQKGIREYLLCRECEQKIQKHEDYVAKIFNGKQPLTKSTHNNIITLSSINYKKFKLFALSILWKCSVSNLPEFKDCALGNHEKKIHDMICNDNPGKALDYPFFLGSVLDNNELADDLIVPPTKTRLENHRCYRLVFCGLSWVFIVSSHPKPEIIKNLCLKENGTVKIGKIQLNKMKKITDFFVAYNEYYNKA